MTGAVPIRSWLFVPGDSEKKLAKIADCGADAVIIDLEDAVAPAHKVQARLLARQQLDGPRVGPQLWVRINPFAGADAAHALADLAAIMPGAPNGIVQPKIDGPDDVARLSHYLDAFESAHGIAAGATRIMAVATETAAAPFGLGAFANAHLPRLAGLSWGAEDLSAALGASTNRLPSGAWAPVYTLARSLCLLAAHAAGVEAIETLHADFRDDPGLTESSVAARVEGFSGRLAIHPAQVATINAAFMPGAADVAHAQAVVAAFAAQPGAGTVALNGAMVDAPHRKAAERLLALSAAYAAR